MGTIKSYGATNEGLAPYRGAVNTLKRARIAIEYGFTAPSTIHRIILTAASVALPAVAAAALIAGQLELWMFIGIALVSTTIFTPIIKLTDAAHMFADLNDSLDRIQAIEHADQILVVEDGRIAQKGTHAQLVAEEGTYRRFVEVRAQAEGWRIG
ncbi:MAG: hypothetical protein J6S36_04095 [Eggerthellaceae bacterium]|nr:hypothetical protein [Eggerthellaceae bacterium]